MPTATSRAHEAADARRTADAIRLPKTATSAELKMIAGLILLVLALILFVFNRRQALAH